MEIEHVFTTIAGVQVPYTPLSMVAQEKSAISIRRRYKDRGEPIDTPTYKPTAVFGGEEVGMELVLDETSIEVDGDEVETARRQALWDAHIDALKRMQTDIEEVRTKMIVHAIKLDLPEDKSWITRQRDEWFIDVPEDNPKKPGYDAEALRRHWLETEVLVSLDDYVKLTARIFVQSVTSGIDEETLEAAMTSFQNRVRGVYIPQRGNGSSESDVAEQPATVEGEGGVEAQ